jgi:hypothetical protein
MYNKEIELLETHMMSNTAQNAEHAPIIMQDEPHSA